MFVFLLKELHSSELMLKSSNCEFTALILWVNCKLHRKIQSSDGAAPLTEWTCHVLCMFLPMFIYIFFPFRHLGSLGALVARRASLPLCPAAPVSTQSRSFINLAAPISTRRMEYTECRTLGWVFWGGKTINQLVDNQKINLQLFWEQNKWFGITF